MYRHQCYEQLKMDLPFGGELDRNNRWIKLAAMFPWKAIDEEYQTNFTSAEGQIAIPARLAFGALYIQTCEGFTDEQTRRHIQENPYPIRENRKWCAEHNKRQSGPRLGRKPAAERIEESKQIYQDGCDRIPVEGTFGVVKRRYDLDRLMTRLPDTSMTSISMGFFAANMERKLRLLFAPEQDWALDYDFELQTLVVYARSCC